MKYVLLVLTVFIISCNSKEKNVSEQETSVIASNYTELEKLDWIIGNWSNINSETSSYEQWTKNNDSVYVGASITLKESDTVFAERMKLYYHKDSLRLYVETIGDNPNPVVFTQDLGAKDSFTFSNWKNPFPSQIVYTQPEKNKIHAWVTGDNGGEPAKMDFYFTRD